MEDFSKEKVIFDSITEFLFKDIIFIEKPPVIFGNVIYEKYGKNFTYSIAGYKSPVCANCALSIDSNFIHFQIPMLVCTEYVKCHRCSALLNIQLANLDKALVFFAKNGLDTTNLVDMHYMFKVLMYISDTELYKKYLATIISIIAPTFPTSFVFD